MYLNSATHSIHDILREHFWCRIKSRLCFFHSALFSLGVKAYNSTSCSQMILPSTLHLFFHRLIWIWFLEVTPPPLLDYWEKACSNTASVNSPHTGPLSVEPCSEQGLPENDPLVFLLSVVGFCCCCCFFSPFKIIFNVEVNCCDMDKNLLLAYRWL